MNYRIRPVQVGDAPQIADIYKYYVDNTAITFDMEAPDAVQTAQQIEECTKKYPWLVCEADGHIVGYAYVHQYRTKEAFDWAVECTVYVKNGRQREGIGTALYKALFAILKAMGIKVVYAAILSSNDASIKMHAGCGFSSFAVFKKCGYKLGAWHDVTWMELALGERDSAPRPPIWAAELDQSKLANICVDSY